MTKSDVKKYLSRAKCISESIDSIDIALNSLSEADAQVSEDARLLRCKMIQDRIDLVRAKTEIISTIQRVENTRQRKLLMARYISFSQWDEIPGIIGVGKSMMWIDYDNALMAVAKLLEE